MSAVNDFAFSFPLFGFHSKDRLVWFVECCRRYYETLSKKESSKWLIKISFPIHDTKIKLSVCNLS